MKVLVGGEKGGTGKTTLATNIAAMRARAGRDVLLVDMDPQGSARSWAASRTKDKSLPQMTCVDLLADEPGEELLRLAEKYDDLVIDIGGREDRRLREAMVAADILVTPAQPSQFDLTSLYRMAEVVSLVKAVNKKLRALVVISRASPNAALASHIIDMREFVAEASQKLETIKLPVHDRIAYRRPIAEGRCVLESDTVDEKAKAEIMSLYEEIFGEPYEEKL